MTWRARRPTAVIATWLAVLGVVVVTAAGQGATDRARHDADVTPAAFDPGGIRITLSRVASGFANPVLVTNAGDGTNRLFVVEQYGLIRVVKNGSVLSTPFLDLRPVISRGAEQGVLGLAFHPSFETNGKFYVDFTLVNGNTAITEYRVFPDRPDVGNRASGRRILTISHPYANHNGGNIAFGPDGYLYIGTGDGGSAGDPGNRAQSLNSLLGKMLRIDVNGTSGTKRYRVPRDNPYLGRAGLDEVWARGLRNPWRWSFDRATTNLWIGDVGQSRYEEIDRSLHGSHPAGWAANYGWRVMEGRHCHNPPSGCSTAGKHPPLVEYSHAYGCSVTGGFVYRGVTYPMLRGGYFFADYCSGRIWTVGAYARTPATRTQLLDTALTISSFGEDERGELYVVDRGGGAIYRMAGHLK